MYMCEYTETRSFTSGKNREINLICLAFSEFRAVL